MQQLLYTALVLLLLWGGSHSEAATLIHSGMDDPDSLIRKANLELILKILPPDRLNEESSFDDRGRVSFLDRTFTDWLNRTGELSPNFDKMPSIPHLPNPLILDEGGKNIAVTTKSQWNESRDEMKKALQHYITGTFPPSPENLKVKILEESLDGEVRLQLTELSFGPNHQAKLTLELMIPPGDGPFPVFLTQWNHREWAQVAVRRGYIGCIYAGADTKDDTEKYSEIWAGRYDFTRLMRRAWGASRAIDYLYMLPEVDKERIAITGHSRNGKTSLMAAAFDERIAACIPSSGGSGAEVPWRYASQHYDVEDIALLASARPSWLHPRLRFFIGREHKLPVDQNSFMALIAPRGLMLSTALTESASNIWGIEQAYQVTQTVYDFLGAEQNLAIHTRYGEHGVSAREMEAYIDFCDFIFKQSPHQPENRLYSQFNFDDWKKMSGEEIHPLIQPVANENDIMKMTNEERKIYKENIIENIHWLLGDEPPGVTNYGPGSLENAGSGEASVGTFLSRPRATKDYGVMPISPYNGFGDQLFGYLYYPLNDKGGPVNNNLPVLIYLHEYDYSKGFNSIHEVETMIHEITGRGIAVFMFDLIGFGNRIEEATRFYDRYPQWSKMGKMVTDTRGAVDALANLNIIDPERIVVGGYSLGGMVGLYAAATDSRIAGVFSIAGFTPMRTNTAERGTEGIMKLAQLHGLQPRLGFFVDQESRIPADFNEIMAVIAPRPVLVVAPEYDRDAHLEDIRSAIRFAKQFYRDQGVENNITLETPADINRFSKEMHLTMYEWLVKNFR